ncbi:ABC transporter substrate-binding protein [Hungatella sp.]
MIKVYTLERKHIDNGRRNDYIYIINNQSQKEKAMKKIIKKATVTLALALAVTSLAACGGKKTEEVQGEVQEAGKTAEGDKITLSLAFNVEPTQEQFEKNVKPVLDKFQGLHPEVDFEYVSASKRTEEQTVTMMKSGKFEDVMVSPMAVSIKEYPNYFASLGDSEELNQKYFYGGYMAYEGQTYALPIGVVYEGILYNKNVLDQYYNGKVPKTLDELKECCKILKDNGVIPFYTNAGAKWTMRFWDNLAVTWSEDPDYANKIVETKEPWAEGTPLNEVLSFVGDLAKNGEVEPDTVTEQWDKSKVAIASGDAAFMLTGSWAIPQIKDTAEELGGSRDNIGFAPFPYKNDVGPDNKLNVRVSEDIFMVVNKNSQHVELATEFVKFFCENISLYRGMNEIIREGGKVVDDLKEFETMDYINLYSVPTKDIRISEMASNSQIDVFSVGSYITKYVLEPCLAGKEPDFDAINTEWGKNFN